MDFNSLRCTACETAYKPGTKQTHCEQLLHQLYRLEGFKRCFFEQCPDAPGLHFVGGQINNRRTNQLLSFTGTGLNRCDALARAYGEACEASSLGILNTVRSSGLGASVQDDEAIMHSIFELIEHDALARWWYDNKKPKPLQQTEAQQKETHQLTEKLRQGINTRRFKLLALNSFLELPVIAAVSFDKQGQCIALGSAVRFSISQTIEASVREMCQMEYAHHLVRDKLNRGGYSVLNHEDKLTIQRASVITEKRLQNHIDESGSSAIYQAPPTRSRLIKYLNTNGVDIEHTRLAKFQGELKVYRSKSRQLRQLVPAPPTQRPNTMKPKQICPFHAFERLLP